jgi:hypothetical protein
MWIFIRVENVFAGNSQVSFIQFSCDANNMKIDIMASTGDIIMGIREQKLGCFSLLISRSDIHHHTKPLLLPFLHILYTFEGVIL